MAKQFKLKEGILDCLSSALGAVMMDMSGMCPLKLWQISFHYPALHALARISSLCPCLHLVLEQGVAGDFVEEDDGENKKKGGEVNAVWKRFW
jgi:hypothetical protein